LRTDDQIRSVLERARRGPAVAEIEWETDWRSGVAATCEWVLGIRAGAPVTNRPTIASGLPTGDDLGREMAPAQDVAWQLGPGRQHSAGYGDGIVRTIQWLRGETTAAPVDSEGRST
jgi:hypothetical protein